MSKIFKICFAIDFGQTIMSVRHDNKNMAVTIEMQNTGDPRLRTEIVTMLEHILGERPGEWRVSIVGTRENDNWEMRIVGPREFERSYTLIEANGDHEPDAVRRLVMKLLPVTA
jgi:hypothetical protein